MDEVLRAFGNYKEALTIGTLAGELQAWNRQQHVASVVGSLVARGMVGEGRDGGWCLTERGEKTARRRGARLLRSLRRAPA